MARAFYTGLVWVVLAVPLFADGISLVRVGDTWRYFRGVSEPSFPVSSWRNPGFNDSSWPSGMAGFTLAGGEATALGTFPTVRSVYFRKTFTLADSASVYWLILRLDYSSGFVAYLNGTEVLRRGLTGDPVPYDAYCNSYHAPGTAYDFDLSSYTDLLRPGQNILAIQVHVSADFRSTMVFVPELLANFQRGPFLANQSTDSIEIVWRTPDWADSAVEFGPSQNLGRIAFDDSLVKSHIIRVTGLAPGTRYYYRLRSSDTLGEAVSPIYSFNTSPMSGDLTFAFVGDSGSGWAAQMLVAQVVAGTGADLVLHTGDIIYDRFVPGYTDTRVMSVYGAHMRSTPYYFTFGNHDVLYSTDQYYLDTFRLPTNTTTGTEHFYSFDYGDAHFSCLYVPMLASNSMTVPYMLFPGSAQYQWLTNDLAQSAKPWKILFLHSPLFDSSFHRFDDANGNSVADRLELQSMLLPLGKRYGVQAVFSGHAHDYEKFAPADGVHAFVTGGGGYHLYSISQHDALSEQFWAIYHCLRVSIHGSTMRVEAIDQFGNKFDETVIQRALPPPQIWQATWHTAKLDTLPANDGDGNILGQTFNLVETPIPTLSGDFSNLGEVYVNNDFAYLYLGLKHSLIADNANIFILIESPRISGVAGMSGLGNGLVDPEGQGADGLDFLKNLGFTNFAPSVACILGDEYADGQFRSFQRPGLGLNIGQGVFNLDSGFSNLPGALLQQFNLTPQLLYPGIQQSYRYERNADFIEVAIPYIALGAVQPGDSLKIAAVVGLGGFDLNAHARDLDSGFIGQAMYGKGQSPVLLEGIIVRLADVPPFTDSDGDGLPDWWEDAYGLDSLSAAGDDGSNGDPDRDGFTNLREYQAWTDPADPSSALWVNLSLVTPQVIRLGWLTVPGRKYVLEYATDLSASFAPVPGPTFPKTAISNTDYYDLDFTTLPPSSGNTFFRLKVLP